MKGSQGLAVPFLRYGGELKYGPVLAKDSLYEVSQYIKSSEQLSQKIDRDRLEHDIKNGLYFNSDIPCGYGVGSSGALCAAILAKYGIGMGDQFTTDNDKLVMIRDLLASLESFYHGVSSGIDPFISYINRAVLIREFSISFPQFDPLDFCDDLYLLDTGISRKTSDFVEIFLNKAQDPKFTKIVDKMVETNNKLIENFLSQKKWDESFKKISQLQFENLPELIPEKLRSLWEVGLKNQSYYCKFCGAGGGGFLIVYNPKHLKSLEGHALTKIKTN